MYVIFHCSKSSTTFGSASLIHFGRLGGCVVMSHRPPPGLTRTDKHLFIHTTGTPALVSSCTRLSPTFCVSVFLFPLCLYVPGGSPSVLINAANIFFLTLLFAFHFLTVTSEEHKFLSLVKPTFSIFSGLCFLCSGRAGKGG